MGTVNKYKPKEINIIRLEKYLKKISNKTNNKLWHKK